jgi:hypothetical protein
MTLNRVSRGVSFFPQEIEVAPCTFGESMHHHRAWIAVFTESQMDNPADFMAPRSFRCKLANACHFVGRLILKVACVAVAVVTAAVGVVNAFFDADSRPQVTVEASMPAAAAPVLATQDSPEAQASSREASLSNQSPYVAAEYDVGRAFRDNCVLLGHEVAKFTSFSLRETGVHVLVAVVSRELAWTFLLVALGLVVASRMFRWAAQYFARKYDVGPAVAAH